MRLPVFFVALLLASLVYGQSPSRILRFASASTVFGENLPAGAILIDIGTGKTYLTLEPLASTKSISSCTAMEIRATSTPWTINNTGLGYSSGNVGIGTTSPETSLDVTGTITARSATGPGYIKIKGTGDSFNYGLVSIDNALSGSSLRIWQIAHRSESPINRLAFNHFDGNAWNQLLTILPGGNVGIGNANPAYKLDVSGAINATSVLINGVAVGAGGTQWASGSGGVISYNGGNVGIGTTSPVNMLEIYGADASANFQGQIVSSDTKSQTTDVGGGIRFGYKYTNAGVFASGPYIKAVKTNAISDDYGAGLTLGVRANGLNPTEVIRITSSGNVGIGTTNPTASLHVNTSGNCRIKLSNTDTGAGSADGFDLVSEGTTKHAYILQREAADIVFKTNGTEENMRIKNGGNVGVGIANPTTKFELSGNYWNGGLLVSGGNSGSGVSINLHSDNTYNWIYNSIYSDVNGNLTMQAKWSDAVARHIILSPANGYVGIRTASPSYTLHVNGSVAGTSAYNNLSDKRFKKDAIPITGALQKVMSLQGITFNWDKTVNPELKVDDKNHIGFLAQDIEKVLPQVVNTAEDKFQTKSVAYSEVIPVLVEAMKEQQILIDLLLKSKKEQQEQINGLIGQLKKLRDGAEK